MLADKNNFESYKLLPKRNFGFYRTTKGRSLLSELDNLTEVKEEKANENNNLQEDEQSSDIKQQEILEPKEGIFGKIVKIIKSGNEIVDAGSSMVTKTMPAVRFLIEHILK